VRIWFVYIDTWPAATRVLSRGRERTLGTRLDLHLTGCGSLAVYTIATICLHCICRGFTVIALCFERGLLQCSCLISWWTKWFRDITVAKLCQYFISKPKRPTADSCSNILNTRTTKNQKLLFTYVNAVVKTSWLGHNKNYNLISVKIRSKEEQRFRSALQWDQRRTDRPNNKADLTIFRWSTNKTLAPRLRSRSRWRRNEAAKWYLNATWTGNVPGNVPDWHSIQLHSTHSTWKTHELNKIESGPDYGRDPFNQNFRSVHSVFSEF